MDLQMGVDLSNFLPPDLTIYEEKMDTFLNKISFDKKICLISSGGTSVPLEENPIRIITNFSTGTRGALMAEYFLQTNEYYVIFISCFNSKKPFLNKLGQTFNDSPEEIEHNFLDVMQNIKMFKDKILVFDISYLNEYLWLLMICAFKLSPRKKSIMYVLSAAVSDYYIPVKDQYKSKFRGENFASLFTFAKQTPKILSPLLSTFAESSYFVTFKLETNKLSLFEQCHKSWLNFGHKLIIGNLLQTRREEVWMYFGPDHIEHVIKNTENIEIEIVNCLVYRHKKHIHKF